MTVDMFAPSDISIVCRRMCRVPSDDGNQHHSSSHLFHRKYFFPIDYPSPDSPCSIWLRMPLFALTWLEIQTEYLFVYKLKLCTHRGKEEEASEWLIKKNLLWIIQLAFAVYVLHRLSYFSVVIADSDRHTSLMKNVYNLMLRQYWPELIPLNIRQLPARDYVREKRVFHEKLENLFQINMRLRHRTRSKRNSFSNKSDTNFFQLASSDQK